jgi:hypothetical protein
VGVDVPLFRELLEEFFSFLILPVALDFLDLRPTALIEARVKRDEVLKNEDFLELQVRLGHP